MRNTNTAKKLILCFTAVLFCASAFSESPVTKTGLVTGILYSVDKKTVTVTVALGTMKAPEKPRNGERLEPPSAEDMITLSGETVSFTVAADTEVDSARMTAPEDPGKNTGYPPPPRLTAKQLSISSIVSFSYDESGTAVAEIKVDNPPSHGMMGPGGNMEPPPAGGPFGAPGTPGGRGGAPAGAFGGGPGGR